MERKQKLRIALWGITAVAGVTLMVAGLLKLGGAQQMVENFARWGYPSWFRLAIGGIELVGGGLLLIPRTATLVTPMLAVDMAGAIVTHVRAGEPALALV